MEWLFTRNAVNITHSLVNSTANEPTIPRVDIMQFSDLTKLLCVTALIVKFVINLKNTARTKSNSGGGTKIHTALELMLRNFGLRNIGISH